MACWATIVDFRIIGAFIGGWLANVLHFHVGTGIIASVITATIGAVVLILILRLVQAPDGSHASNRPIPCLRSIDRERLADQFDTGIDDAIMDNGVRV